MKKFILSFVFILVVKGAFCQKELATTDFGIFLGGSYYLGDLNPVKHFDLTKPAFGVLFRYNLSNRFSARGNLLYGNVMGDDARSDSYAQQQRNLSFKSNILEFSAMMEFNFVEYKIGNEKAPFSPYVFLGMGIFKYEPRADVGGNWVDLPNLRTEGQDKTYKIIQPSIPFGVGVKLNLAKRLGLCIEWGMRKTFTDYIDDVSKTYADPTLMANPLAAYLSDRSAIPEQNNSNVGRQRGNPRTKDWYSFAGITLNFKLNMKNEPCYQHY